MIHLTASSKRSRISSADMAMLGEAEFPGRIIAWISLNPGLPTASAIPSGEGSMVSDRRGPLNTLRNYLYN